TAPVLVRVQPAMVTRHWPAAWIAGLLPPSMATFESSITSLPAHLMGDASASCGASGSGSATGSGSGSTMGAGAGSATRRSGAGRAALPPLELELELDARAPAEPLAWTEQPVTTKMLMSRATFEIERIEASLVSAMV